MTDALTTILAHTLTYVLTIVKPYVYMIGMKQDQEVRRLQAARALDERRIALLEAELDVIRSTLKRAKDPVLFSKAKSRIVESIDRTLGR